MSAAPELISPRSPRVSAARRLAKRNFRGKEQLFLAEGPQAVREAAAHRAADAATLVELFATAEAAERYADIIGEARDAGARVHLADEAVIADISTTVTPRGSSGSAASWTPPSRRSSRPGRGSSPYSPMCATRGTPAPCCAAPTPPAPRPSY
ncbi:hypothetical protein SAV31267_022200 [Streptomyces avermitilis]|uniref:RNA 2-O ribose methyltransferase substrate binding domain-containing protein n=1 Tax=Streptomyces avermitilis TaxID=33903 RepID=A0A4D4MMB2_STRAX|nr:hypothetical protein SAV31267_022200 [Streptomyces avermitilis]